MNSSGVFTMGPSYALFYLSNPNPDDGTYYWSAWESRFNFDVLSTNDGTIHVVYYGGDFIKYIHKDNTDSGNFMPDVYNPIITKLISSIQLRLSI